MSPHTGDRDRVRDRDGRDHGDGHRDGRGDGNGQGRGQAHARRDGHRHGADPARRDASDERGLPSGRPATGRSTLDRLRAAARRLRRDAYALWLAARDPRMPLAPKLVALAVAAYAFSPIDLVPDFVPVLGLLDELVIVPLGVLLVLRLAPPALIAECRARAASSVARPVSRLAAALIVLLWTLAAWWAWRTLR